MSIKFKLDDSKFGREVRKAQGVPDRLADDAYKFFKKTTPIRSGNARRNTKLKGSSIQANYPYAQRLDSGYSRQAPKGMTEPTIKYLNRKFEVLLRRLFRG